MADAPNTIEVTETTAECFYFRHCLDGIMPEPSPHQVSIFYSGDRIIWAGLSSKMPPHIQAILDSLEGENPHVKSWARIKADFARARSGRCWPRTTHDD